MNDQTAAANPAHEAFLSPEAVPTRRERLIHAMTGELTSLLDQARQQRRPASEDVVRFVAHMVDAGAELAYEHVLERAQARVRERERVAREAEQAGALLDEVNGGSAASEPTPAPPAPTAPAATPHPKPSRTRS
jgi:hypothetical protein